MRGGWRDKERNGGNKDAEGNNVRGEVVEDTGG